MYVVILCLVIIAKLITLTELILKYFAGQLYKAAFSTSKDKISKQTNAMSCYELLWDLN